MVVESGTTGSDLRVSPKALILLDTHALLWLAQRHRRAAVLELRLSNRLSINALADDERWRVDEPPAFKWCLAACDLPSTRDPFDRLIVAHARVRGWRLATADDELLDQLTAAEVLAL